MINGAVKPGTVFWPLNNREIQEERAEPNSNKNMELMFISMNTPMAIPTNVPLKP